VNKNKHIVVEEQKCGVTAYPLLADREGVESRDLLFEFWDPLSISGTVWARNFKFGVQIDYQGHYRKYKSRSKWAGKGSSDLLL